MSDALDYLMKVRPAAMESYFGFLREAGKHLDPKTRAIISVITKVDNQTERGFRQYLGRALRAGVTPDEILDALLVAFPTLGLSKIIWAVDRLLEMDIPEFGQDRLGDAGEWHQLADAVSTIAEGVSSVRSDGRSVLICRTNGDIHVYDARCPHQSTVIPETALEGSVLICPKHSWRFDLASGECLGVGDRPLARLECRTEDGKLQAYW